MWVQWIRLSDMAGNRSIPPPSAAPNYCLGPLGPHTKIAGDPAVKPGGPRRCGDLSYWGFMRHFSATTFSATTRSITDLSRPLIEVTVGRKPKESCIPLPMPESYSGGLMRRTEPPDIQREPLPKRMVEYSDISTLKLPRTEFVPGSICIIGTACVLTQTNPPPTAIAPLPKAPVSIVATRSPLLPSTR